MTETESKLFKKAFALSLFTVFYNIAEGVVSIVLGVKDETLSLFGFGADSFIEVMSGLGITFMILRIRRYPDSPKSRFEITALRITGTAFILLSAGLLSGVVLNVVYQRKPETTLWGIIISLVSLVVMYWLMSSKKTVGRDLESEPVIADAKCTMVCIYMSLVLLISSLVYELTGFAYADVIGAGGLIYLSVKEGIESFEKASKTADNCAI
jgi:divalent metal cation (Fe/Co/Zn/Cd) transporter